MSFTNDLQGFCFYLVHKYGDPGALSEEQKADEFRKMYVMDSPVKLKDIRAVAVCCNINKEEVQKLKPQIERTNPVIINSFHRHL